MKITFLTSGKLTLLGDCLVVVECVGSRPSGLSFYDGHLHVLDLYPDQQKVNFADDDIFKVISRKKNGNPLDSNIILVQYMQKSRA